MYNENKKVFTSQKNVNTFNKDIFNIQELPQINKSTFELQNYYKSMNKKINDIMKEEKFNMINEIKQLNDSITESQKIKKQKKNNDDDIEEDLKSNSSIESLCPKDTNIYLKPYEWNKNMKEKEFNKMILSIMNNDEIINFKNNLEKLYLTGPECDEVILFNNIGSLNKYEDKSENCNLKNNNANIKTVKDEKYLMWRKIKGDGNCYYRSIMFALIENIILTNDINYLRKIIISFIEKSKNKILLTMFNGLNLDINLVKKCFIMIYLSITSKSHDPILKAYIVFYKMINNYKDFDYGLILFFKFILYQYIEQNKNSTYSFKFQVLIGNLLPNDCQNDNGNFNFSFFYKNYLMKFYQYAEKIIIYLTPFIFGKEIIIKYINEKNGMDADIQQFEFGKNISYIDFDNSNKIELLYKKTHYDLLYNNKYYNMYENIFKLTLFNLINNFQVNVCQICTKNNDKNSILIKLESDIIKNIDGYEVKPSKVIICYKCLFKEIKHNFNLLYMFFIQKIKKYFLDNFTENITDFLQKTFILSNKSMEVTYSHSIDTLSKYRPKYTFEYIIKQIKNEICICCNANINENKTENDKIKPKIILPCKCILCTDNCMKEFYYILLSGAYIKQEFICFCNQKYNFEDCLLMIEKYNEKKYDCKEMIEFILIKQNKNKCFICLEENKNNRTCMVIEPKFCLNHIIKHYLCDNCYSKNEYYLGQNIECKLCKRNHVIDKFCDKLKDDYIKGYNLEIPKQKKNNNSNKAKKEDEKNENKNNQKININNKDNKKDMKEDNKIENKNNTNKRKETSHNKASNIKDNISNNNLNKIVKNDKDNKIVNNKDNKKNNIKTNNINKDKINEDNNNLKKVNINKNKKENNTLITNTINNEKDDNIKNNTNYNINTIKNNFEDFIDFEDDNEEERVIVIKTHKKKKK